MTAIVMLVWMIEEITTSYTLETSPARDTPVFATSSAGLVTSSPTLTFFLMLATTGDAPLYIINGVDSELDTYEPQFSFPEETWLRSNYTVELTVTDPDVTEIFYFCHIHDNMSGRCDFVFLILSFVLAVVLEWLSPVDSALLVLFLHTVR